MSKSNLSFKWCFSQRIFFSLMKVKPSLFNWGVVVRKHPPAHSRNCLEMGVCWEGGAGLSGRKWVSWVLECEREFTAKKLLPEVSETCPGPRKRWPRSLLGGPTPHFISFSSPPSPSTLGVPACSPRASSSPRSPRAETATGRSFFPVMRGPAEVCRSSPGAYYQCCWDSPPCPAP